MGRRHEHESHCHTSGSFVNQVLMCDLQVSKPSSTQ
jgi:hypothetical protein